MLYLGDFPTGETIYIPFHTFSSDDPSASMTITGLATTDIEIYKDGGTTQRSSDSGFALLDTDGIDFDGITGIHGISIDTSDNTDAGFYVAGSDYWVAISSITLDGATINFIAAIFSIDNRGLLRPTTASRTLDVTATGAAGIDWGNIENKTTANDLSATDIQLCDTVTTLTGHTAQTGDSFAIVNGDHGLVSIQDDVDAILADTGELQTNQGNWTTVTGHATEAKQDIIDTNVDQIEAAVITNAAGVDVAADIIALKAETATIVADTGELQTNQGNWATITGHATEAKQDIIDTNVDQIEAAVITNAAGVDIAADIIAIKAETATIVADTNELQTNQGNWATVTGHATEAKQDTIDTVVDGIQTDLSNGTDGLGALKALIDALNDLDAAAINAQVLDVLNTDTFAEPGDEAPTATTTLVNKIGYLYKFLRNKVETTSTRIHVYDDAGSNKDHSSVISDDGSTFTRGEFGAGD